jgi:hypothetical protein
MEISEAVVGDLNLPAITGPSRNHHIADIGSVRIIVD